MPKPPCRPNQVIHRICILGVMLLLGLPSGVLAQKDSPDDATMRVGFSSAVFTGINMIDARNSIKSLTASLAREYDIPTDKDPLIYENVDEAEAILNQRLIGTINMTTSDYWLLRKKISLDRFLVTVQCGTPDETYILLVKKDGRVAKLADLRGKHLTMMTSPAMTLATVWLDVELSKHTLPPTTELLGSILKFPKPAKVVLPVFFGQADACLVTRRAYDTMVELNPEVGRQLSIIATSPICIAALFGLRSDYPSGLKEKTIRAFAGLHQTSHGRQLLALFQTEKIIECPISSFENSLALLDEHARLCPEASATLIATLRGRPPATQPTP